MYITCLALVITVTRRPCPVRSPAGDHVSEPVHPRAAYLRCQPPLLYHQPGALQSVAGLLTTILGNIVAGIGGGAGSGEIDSSYQ